MLKELLQLPNLLSLSRILLTPVIGYYLALGDKRSTIICVILLMVAGLTDGFDGYLARKMNKISKLGIMLDPLADKIFAAFLVILLILYRDFPLWLALVIVGRDLLIIVAGGLIFRGKNIAVPSNLTGKYTFTIIAFLLGSYVIRFEFGIIFCTYLTLLMIVLSLYNYTRTFIYVRAKGEPPVFKDNKLYLSLRILVQISFLVIFFYKLYQYLF